MTINIVDIDRELPNDVELFICTNSYEKRWSKIALSSNFSSLKKLVVINPKTEVDEESIEKLEEKYGHIIHFFDIDNKVTINAWKALALDIIPAIKECMGSVVIDISTLNKELLLFLIYQIKLFELQGKIYFTYLGAKSYGSMDSTESLWITRGVKDIRSVIGYPGGFTPSKKLHHLIIMVGFELDRAKELILEYEPSSISLGIGIDPYVEGFYDENQRSMDNIREFISSLGIVYKSVSEFTFSCSDVQKAKKSILEEAEKYVGSNITISPMNTKVSTVALGLAAIENEDIKICYVEPLEYNKESYSEIGDAVTVFRLDN